MTTTSDPRPAGPAADPEVLHVGRGLLLPDRSAPDGRHLPSVVISPARDATPLRTDPCPDVPGGPDDPLPMLDAWIVDLSLRHERVTVVAPTEVLCSAPLVSVPPGWMAEVSARGLLAVVVPAGAITPAAARVPVPLRAMRSGASLAARIPVCLSD